MSTLTQRQLSLDIGGRAPDEATLKFSGSLKLNHEIPKGSEVHIRVADADGQVLVEGYRRVVAVTGKDTLDEFGDVESCTREHGIKLG